MAKKSGPELNFDYFNESGGRVLQKDVSSHHSILVSWGNQQRQFTGKTQTVRKEIRAWADSSLQLSKGQRDAISKVFMYDYGLRVVSEEDRDSKIRKERIPNAFEDIKNHWTEFERLGETEKDAIIKSRLGQGRFRKRLIEKWGSCSVTGLSNSTLLKASHIKPWRDSSNAERLDPYNGLLLSPNLDTLFDSGLITFNDEGSIRIASQLTNQDLKLLHVHKGLCLRKVFCDNKKYLKHHRENVFNRNSGGVFQ